MFQSKELNQGGHLNLKDTSSRSHVHTFKAETSIRTDTVTVTAVQCVQAGVPDQRCATVVQLYTCT